MEVQYGDRGIQVVGGADQPLVLIGRQRRAGAKQRERRVHKRLAGFFRPEALGSLSILRWYFTSGQASSNCPVRPAWHRLGEKFDRVEPGWFVQDRSLLREGF